MPVPRMAKMSQRRCARLCLMPEGAERGAKECTGCCVFVPSAEAWLVVRGRELRRAKAGVRS
jgi:hypothetical protein